MAKLTSSGRARSPRIELLWRNLEPGEAERQAARFVHDNVDVIVAFEDKSIAAAQAATSATQDRIPVVFLHPSDPVRVRPRGEPGAPGGNLTGVFGARDPVVKQLELYQQIMPGLKRLLTLVDPDDPSTPPLLAQAQDAAEKLGLELDIREASEEADLERVFHALAPGEVEGVFLLSPSLRLNHSKGRSSLRQKPTCLFRPTARNGSKRGHSSRWESTWVLSVPPAHDTSMRSSRARRHRSSPSRRYRGSSSRSISRKPRSWE